MAAEAEQRQGPDVALCGWRVASALPLPELLPWTGEDRAPDLTVAVSAVPARLSDTVFEAPLWQAAADGTCRFAFPGIAAYQIDPEGRHILVDPATDSDARDVRVMLLGTVFGLACYRRGLLPLHACCIRIGEAAVAVAGVSGIGKSTLAAALMRQGFSVLADDVTVIDPLATGGSQVRPSFPRVRLWSDAMRRLGISPNGLERTRLQLDKYHLPLGDSFHAAPLPLRAVFHLEPGFGSVAAPRRLVGSEAMVRLSRDLYRGGMAMRLGLGKRILPGVAAIASVCDGTWTMEHSHEEGGLERTMGAILERVTP